MYGHVETARHRAAHIATIREIQKETGGITEFVPLSLIHEEAPMYRKGTVPGVRETETSICLRVHKQTYDYGTPD